MIACRNELDKNYVVTKFHELSGKDKSLEEKLSSFNFNKDSTDSVKILKAESEIKELNQLFPSGRLFALCDLIVYSGSAYTVYLVLISSPSYKSKRVKHLVVSML